MKAKGTTIDQLGIEIHKRWAVDQEKLDLRYIQESNLISSHSEIAGTSSIYSSKWAQLFEFDFNYTTWAAFIPPPNYKRQRNRFFSFDITPKFGWLQTDKDKGEENQKGEEDEQKKQFEVYKERLKSKKPRLVDQRLIEHDQKVLLSLLDSMKSIHDLLREIQAKKLQYQKG